MACPRCWYHAGTFLGEVTSNNRIGFTLSKTGTYTVLVDAQDLARIGDYGVVLHRIAPPLPVTGSPTLGVPLPGTLAAAGESHIYTFAVTSGQTLNAGVVVNSGFSPAQATVTVYQPDGTLVGAIGTAGALQSFSFTAPVTGNYIFVVNANDVVATGTYELQVF